MTGHPPSPLARVTTLFCVGLLLGGCCGGGDRSRQERCAFRQDRPDLGAPVHPIRGGSGAPMVRLPNGWRVEVLITDGRWLQVRFPNPEPSPSSPQRRTGWVLERYLRPCVGVTSGSSAAAPAAGAVKICWWNSRRLGQGDKDWRAAARALRGCQIIGLGEVMDRRAPGHLADALGEMYGAVVSERAVGRTDRYREHAAVVYDRAAAEAVVDGSLGFLGLYPDRGDRFAREPWSVPMRSGEFDFVLTLIHVTWGDRVSQRVAELEQLDEVITWLRGQDRSEGDQLLLGDFNRTPRSQGWEQLGRVGLKMLITRSATTLNQKGQPRNLYDNILIAPPQTREWTGEAGVITDVGVPLQRYQERVSDHLPVWASFRTTGPDDD